jgi:hypothetical protein
MDQQQQKPTSWTNITTIVDTRDPKEKVRFNVELEFVQTLSNPDYLLCKFMFFYDLYEIRTKTNASFLYVCKTKKN